MISESQHIVIDIKNKLNTIDRIQSKKPNILEGEPPRLHNYKIGDQIVVLNNILDDMIRNLK